MNTKTKAAIFSTVLVLAGVAAAFFTSDIWQFIRYHYSYNYVPPMIEAVLVANVGVEEGELLPEEELRAFWAEFDGKFEGYYDSMPESVRTLSQNFKRGNMGQSPKAEPVDNRCSGRALIFSGLQVTRQVHTCGIYSGKSGFVYTQCREKRQGF